MSRVFFSATIAAVLLSSAGARAGYTGLGPAAGYNDYVLGNFTQSGTDAGGSGPNAGMGVAVGGDFTSAGFTVHGNVVVHGNYTNAGNSIDGSIFGYNNVSFSNETVGGSVNAGKGVTIVGGSQPGSIYYVTTASVPSYYNASQIHQVGSITQPVDFGSTNAYLIAETALLHSTSSTAGVTFSGNALTLTGAGSNYYDFQVTAAQFASANAFTINVTGLNGQMPTVVVDVLNGTTGASFPSLTASYNGVDNQHVLFNFAGTGTVTNANSAIEGAVLAPNAAFAFNGGHIDGTLIAGSLSGSGESHAYAFQGNIPSAVVPEPASLALMGVGGLGLAALARRRLRAA